MIESLDDEIKKIDKWINQRAKRINARPVGFTLTSEALSESQPSPWEHEDPGYRFMPSSTQDDIAKSLFDTMLRGEVLTFIYYYRDHISMKFSEKASEYSVKDGKGKEIDADFIETVLGWYEKSKFMGMP